jgi:hypothetical protein
MAVLDHVEHKVPCRIQRGRLQKCQIAPLPGDELERPVEAFDMIRRYWNNLDPACHLNRL